MLNKSFIENRFSEIAWTLIGAVSIVSIISLLERTNGQIFGISNYLLFPFFGILAFSIMWVHYFVGGLKNLYGIKKAVRGNYFEITAWVVLFSILLHPGLLSYQLFVDGAGLPPTSYMENYVAPGMAWAAFLGFVSLLVFLLFEGRHKFAKKHWWKYVEYANAVAIWAIYIHAIALGTVLVYDWLKVIWVFYGITLFAAMLLIYTPLLNKFKLGKK